MEDFYYIIECGKKRKAIEKVCLFCGNKFLERANHSKPRKYCGVECRDKALQKRQEVECGQCGKKFSVPVSKTTNTKSGYKFCSMDCKNFAQRVGGIEAVKPKHYGKAARSPEIYRRVYKEVYQVDKLKCERCGYCEFECGVDIHHKDENKANNHKDNLAALCAPCHRALHYGYWNL